MKVRLILSLFLLLMLSSIPLGAQTNAGCSFRSADYVFESNNATNFLGGQYFYTFSNSDPTYTSDQNDAGIDISMYVPDNYTLSVVGANIEFNDVRMIGRDSNDKLAVTFGAGCHTVSVSYAEVFLVRNRGRSASDIQQLHLDALSLSDDIQVTRLATE
jgi:hypothetical protein